MRKKSRLIVTFCLKHKFEIIFGFLLAAHIFLRFYQLTTRASLGWDQTDSAWAANQIITNHHFVLEGVPVKGNTALTMGPLYYYLITPFYFFTYMDPIASPIFAGVVSIVGFFVLFYVTKKIFNTPVALIALFINTFAMTIIGKERVQNAIGFIVPVSYLIFYFLYKVIKGEEKYIPWLTVALGFSFHVDFTSIFYPIIVFLALPFFPRTKKTIHFSLISLPILLLFLFPMLITELGKDHATTNSLVNLYNTTFHGVHLQRILQLTHDAFVQFLVIFEYKFLDYFDFLIPVIFAVIYYFQNPKREQIIFSYLLFLWILIPWFVLATYRGELTDSYFSLPRDLFIAIMAYVTWLGFKQKFIVFKVGILIFWGYFMISNIQLFFKPYHGDFLDVKRDVNLAIQNKTPIPFRDHDPRSYVYYIYTR